jgi:glycosyltransferase involved in cell wall biosynthesis
MFTRKNINVALVHDWLTGMRGGEKVLEILCELYPEAPIYTLLYNQGSLKDTIESHLIKSSFIDRLPFKSKKYPYYLPLFPTAIEMFKLKDFDVVISTSHCVAKGIISGPNTLHISYLHTPMRYVWDMYHDYFKNENLGWIVRLLTPVFANYLRMWDVSSSNRVDKFIANSRHVAKRIEKFYGRKSMVIHPPVNTDRFPVSRISGDFFLVVSALVPYKKIDLAVRTFNILGWPLIIIGSGPERKKLEKFARPNITFLDWQPHEELHRYYSTCKALIFPGEEDFGIVPVEAMSCGKPVVAYGRGGILETIIDSKENDPEKSTGVLFKDQNEEGLIGAMEQFQQLNWNPDFISRHARKFDRKEFKKKLSEFIEESVRKYFERRQNLYV